MKGGRTLRNLILTGSLLGLFGGCSKSTEPTKPGPIEAYLSISPSIVHSGGNTNITLRVQNKGSAEVTIQYVDVEDCFIEGWAAPTCETVKLSLSTYNVPPGGTSTVYSQSHTFYNNGPTNIGGRATVDVRSNGGNASDIAFYTILNYSSSLLSRSLGDSTKRENPVARGLVDKF